MPTALLSHQRQDGFDHVEHVEAVRLEQLVNSSSMIVERYGEEGLVYSRQLVARKD